MALGDYSKTTYVNGGSPAINAARLNNTENKVKELDTAAALSYTFLGTGGKKIATGSATISASAGTTSGVSSVTLPTGFASAPVVVMSLSGAVSETDLLTGYTQAISASSFGWGFTKSTVRALTVQINWIAIGS